MHPCLSTNPILQQIISKLDLSAKFGVQGVCFQWKDIAIECLRRHQHVFISEERYIYFSHYHCDEHLSLMKRKKIIGSKYSDIKFWQRIVSSLPGVKLVCMLVPTDVYGRSFFRNYEAILQLLIDSYGQSLECLCIPKHFELYDETFPLTDSLPSLRHMIIGFATSQVTKNILSACPNLEDLRLRTSFTEWQTLPKGFKKLQKHTYTWDTFNGINNLLSSPAVESLEFVTGFVMTSEICYKSYHLSSLKKFDVTILLDVTKCLTHLARILSFAPVLRELDIFIEVYDVIEPQAWIKVLSECQTLTYLRACFERRTDREIGQMNVCSWQDDFAKIVCKMKKLEYLDIGFQLSSDGLRLLSQLEHLQFFRHELNGAYWSDYSVFNTDALVYFLSQALSKKLTYYEFDTCNSGKYLSLKKTFLDFANKLKQQYPFKLTILYEFRPSFLVRLSNEFRGIINVTRMYLGKKTYKRLK